MAEQPVTKRAPHQLDEFGISADTAAEILILDADNPERIRSKAVFATLAEISAFLPGQGRSAGGIASTTANPENSTGRSIGQWSSACRATRTRRFRLHAKRPKAKANVASREASSLKRHVVREVYRLLEANPRTGEVGSWAT
jgi:hypothetical protein